MRHLIAVFAAIPFFAWGQANFPTDFPSGAVALEPSVVQQKLTDQVFDLTYANGQQVRVEYKQRFAYVNTANASDSGAWHVEPGKVCVAWQRFPAGCFEVRAVGDLLYAKRAINGEIVLMKMR